MSIDESAHIHEFIGWQLDALLPEGSRENTIFSVTGIWMIAIGIPFILIFAWVAYSVKDFLKDSKFNFKLFIVGIVVLLTGAIGVETLSNFAEGGLLVMQITVEESLEMLGVTIMIWSAYELAMENLAHLLNSGPESNLFKQ